MEEQQLLFCPATFYTFYTSTPSVETHWSERTQTSLSITDHKEVLLSVRGGEGSWITTLPILFFNTLPVMGNSPLIFPVLGSILPPKYCLSVATQTHSPKPSIPWTDSANAPDQRCNHLACTNWVVNKNFNKINQRSIPNPSHMMLSSITVAEACNAVPGVMHIT